MKSNLHKKTSRAVAWSFIDRLGQQGIQFLISIVLARLLSPKEFGVIGMLAIFMVLAQSFIESGFGQALIQKRDSSHVAECSVFYFNILIGLAAVGVLWIAAPFIAQFFQMPVLAPITRVSSLNLLINAFGLIQTTLLTRELDFRTLVKAGLSANVVSGAIAIIMAVSGYGVWSLVWQAVISNLLRNALLWWLHRWRPAFVFSRAELGQLFRFGSKLLAYHFLRRTRIFHGIVQECRRQRDHIPHAAGTPQCLGYLYRVIDIGRLVFIFSFLVTVLLG